MLCHNYHSPLICYTFIILQVFAFVNNFLKLFFSC
ncbi:hypothetical protein [Staphylococcus phage vB_SauM-T-SE-G1]|nr:hypothetical protein [Staphylococcus phage vB_SauM-V1SA15]